MFDKIKLILIFIFILNEPALCQKWVENILAQHFEKDAINDLGVLDSCLWVNTGVLVKYDGFDFTSYSISSESSGSLRNFIGSKPSGSIFKMTLEHDVILLIDNYNDKLLVIENNYVNNYDFSKIGQVLTNISIDNDRTIWLKFLSGKYSENNLDNEVYFIKNGKFIKYDSAKHLRLPSSLFFVNGNIKYFVCYKKTEFGDSVENKFTIINEGNNIKEYRLDTYKYNYGFKYYKSGDLSYILSAKGNLYSVINDSLSFISALPGIDSNRCFDFTVVNNTLYYSVLNRGLNNNNLISIFNMQTYSVSGIQIYYEFRVYFTKMTVFKNYIIGSFSNCNLDFAGLKILRYE